VVIDNSRPTKWERTKVVLLFSFLGPPAAAFPIAIVAAITSLMSLSGSFAEILNGLFVYGVLGPVFMVIGAYVFGLIPALITGAIYQWSIFRRIGRSIRDTVVMGISTGFLVSFALAICSNGIFLQIYLEKSLYFAVVGGIAGGVCAYVDGRRRVTRSEKQLVITDAI